ncbi:MAG TPA: glycosyltransferase [Gemmatimonadaceae bacterium]|nr:glycosyltransferase [Gemmatimonadaceae bacterium]
MARGLHLGVRRSGGMAAMKTTIRPPTLAPGEVAEARIAPHGGLGTATLAPAGDGIAYASRLLHRALSDLGGGDPMLIELGATGAEPVTLRTRMQFLARLARLQSLHRVNWMLFTHVGIARAQLRVPKAWRRPYAVMLHGIESWDHALEPERLAAMREARLRIAISAHTARRVAAAHPSLPPIDTCLLALLPDEEHPDRVPGDVRVDFGPHAVVIVGRMSSAERYKGHDQLILAWPRVLAEVPDATLVMVGRGDDVQRLHEKAAAIGVSRSVHFTGFLPDAAVRAVLRHAAVFAMPSRGEGFGLVYLQAMRAGVPCLGSRDDAAGDVIIDGETGLLVPHQDPEAIAGAVARLLTDDGMRRRFGEAGKRRFESVFTYPRFRARLAGLLSRGFPAAKTDR